MLASMTNGSGRAAALQLGTAALFALVTQGHGMLEGLKGEGGTVLKTTSLDHTKEAALQAALAGAQTALPASPA
jgi:uncharacterized membrane protein